MTAVADAAGTRRQYAETLLLTLYFL